MVTVCILESTRTLEHIKPICLFPPFALFCHIFSFYIHLKPHTTLLFFILEIIWIYLFTFFVVFLNFWAFSWNYFPSTLRNSLIFLSGLLMTNSLNFCLSIKLYFHQVYNSRSTVIFFKEIKEISSLPFGFISLEKFTVHLIGVPVKVMHHLFPAHFKSPFYLWFSSV